MFPIIDLAMKGGMCSVFAYGQTGSGKTYTIQGIMTRLADDLFKRQTVNNCGSSTFKITA